MKKIAIASLMAVMGFAFTAHAEDSTIDMAARRGGHGGGVHIGGGRHGGGVHIGGGHRRGGVRIGIGIGIGRGGWGRGGVDTCVARNHRGQSFWGRAWNRSTARSSALNQCYRYSRSCYIAYCN